MRLFEAIIHANHRAAAGDNSAGLRPADFADALPVAALTCVDPRLNSLLPGVLGIPEDQFIWLRNAGNVITSPLSSTMRSLALACAIKSAEEIAIIGHTDCQVAKATAFQVLERLREMGVNRMSLPDNINEFFGMFSSERANLLKSVAFARSSPLIGSKVPVHGLLVDIENGTLEWLVNGYESLGQNLVNLGEQLGAPLGHATDMLKNMADFNLGDLKFPDVKIGEIVGRIGEHLDLKHQEPKDDRQPQPPTPPPVVEPPRRIPLPRPARPKLFFKRPSK